MMNLKKITFVLMASLSLLFFSACEEDEEEKQVRVEEPNVPLTFEGRPVRIAGTTNLDSKTVTFKVWDSGTIDGDIITLSVNGVKVLTNYTLTANKRSIDVTLDNFGYNHVLLFAHNEGSLPPNTAAISIVNANGVEKNLVLSANLTTCEARNLYVQ